MTTGSLARELTKALEAVSDCASFEARCLMEHFLKVSVNDLILDREIRTPLPPDLHRAVQQRLQHVPLQYILGKWSFMGRDYFLNEQVLIPRPETELLCEAVQGYISRQSVVYDLCAGSGCIAVSLAKMTGAKVYAVEKYDGACSVMQKNIALHQAAVEPLQRDITTPPDASLPQADLIVSNPPYIRTRDLEHLQAEVQQEPLTALDGGADGLVFYRAILQNYIPLLKQGGYAAFEIGEGQAEDVKNIFCSLRHIKTIQDYNHIDRIVIFGKDIA